ncbi:MAG: tetratricopeptide repeat protein [Acidobacteria bacterium]|nr:tetratricopeptide repeat protein [Acidobacteriota bacterium]
MVILSSQRPLLLILIVVLPLLISARTPQGRPLPPGGCEINGQLRYADGGAPAEKIIVRLEEFSGGVADQILTDRTGKFRFSGLKPAIYMITIRAVDYIEIKHQIDLQTTFREYVQLQLVSVKKPPVKAPGSSLIINVNIPAEAQSEFDLGRKILLEEKKVEGGISHLEKAVSIYPDFLDAHLLLGTAYLDTRDFVKAERELRRVLEIKLDTPLAYFTLGEVYRRQKKFDEAEKALQDGLKLEPNSHQGHFTLGQVYIAKGDIAKAGPEIGQTLKLKPDFAEAYVVAGNLFMKARQAENALGMFQEYLRLEPNGQLAQQTREIVDKIKKALAEKK